MTEKIFNLLEQQPVLSIVLGFVLTIVLAIVFKKVIVDYIRKKYDLYTKDEIEDAVKESVSVTSLKQQLETTKLPDDVLRNLKRK